MQQCLLAMLRPGSIANSVSMSPELWLVAPLLLLNCFLGMGSPERCDAGSRTASIGFKFTRMVGM
jgi:hypothetical protein